MPHPIINDLEKIADKTARESGYDLCCVLVHTHLNPMTVQVQIKKKLDESVSLEDCAQFSIPMGKAIESSEILKEPYVLEISSAGLSDHLITDKDFQTFQGFPIEVIYQNKENDEQKKTGLLHKRSVDHVQLNIKGRINRILRSDVIRVRLISPTG